MHDRNPLHLLAFGLMAVALGLVLLTPEIDPRIRIGVFYAGMTALAGGFIL